MAQQERREHFRNYLDQHKPVAVELEPRPENELGAEDKDAAPGRKSPFVGVIRNLSLGGMLVRLDDADLQLKTGNQFVATFTLPGNDDPLVFDAVVMNSQTLIAGHRHHGFRLSGGERQEKALWKFLTEEQRRQKQLLFENARMERQQLTGLMKSLQELLPFHAAVARAQTKGWSILITIAVGLAGCAITILALNAMNSGIWDKLVEKHDVAVYRAGPPDYDALVPAERVQAPPFARPEEIAGLRREAEDKRDKEIHRQQQEYERRMKPVLDEYGRLATSATLIGTFAVMVGIVLAAGLSIFFQHRRPHVLARACQDLENKIQAFAQKHPEEVQSWGGPSALDSAAKVEGIILGLSARLQQSMAEK